MAPPRLWRRLTRPWTTTEVRTSDPAYIFATSSVMPTDPVSVKIAVRGLM